ncbi:hypothetical protein F0U62_04820 [Cystobacter fuscus]|uniref:hypothetical protein n=1 Tax=Cystobacter fuscus TaxID=43 RepID=UPI002B2BD5D6|nr:hypothetical protein F0U62_04820 [Cystobacter fuscus]
MRFNFRHILPLALLSTGCGVESSLPEQSDVGTEVGQQEQVGEQEQALSMRWLPLLDFLVESCDVRLLGDFTREHVTGDIYHYSVRVQVGPDAQHDIIGLHRVVRERFAWQPVSASESAFLVHGDAWDFEDAFLPGTQTKTARAESSFAVYLANQDVDVWGIDLRWTQVPLETADFSFMKGWSLGTHAEDVGKAMGVARRVRTLTGSGNGKMNLLGWSRGAQVAYAYMSAETREPASQRHVSGFIPVDMVFKFGPEAQAERQAACERAQAGEAILAQGRYEGNLGGPGAGLAILAVGQGALNSPNTPAQAPLPPLPYGQLGVTLGAATYSFISAPVPFYHFTAGEFANESLVGLKYVSSPRFFDFLASANPYQSLREQVEGDALQCGTTSLPYDDHLDDVKVPVLYVGAAGGFGTYGEYTVKSLLGSKDVTILRARRDLDRAAEYGHADLWLASDAQAKVWEPIYKWMKKH